jgi:hypothetical protein
VESAAMIEAAVAEVTVREITVMGPPKSLLPREDYVARLLTPP